MTTATDPQSPRKPLATGPAALLVAEREISTQLRSKAFIISLAVMVVLVIGGLVGMNLVNSDDDEQEPVAVVNLQGEASTLEAAGLDPQGVTSEEEAEALLREGEVEAIITSDSSSPAGLRVVGLDEEPTTIAGMLAITPTTEVLEPDSTEGPLRAAVALGFGLVFMVVALGSGMMIVQNTIQEKQNRIVELLLAAISARALLAGKILGNSALALAQAVVLGAAAAAGLMLTGQQDVLDILTVPMLWFVVFFIPGFVLVAAMFAASASLVSRQEDSGNVITPTMMLVMAPYFVVVFFYNNTLAMTIASYVPFSAPVAMPLRMFFNEAMWFEPLLALGVLILFTALVMWLAAKIYSRSLLRTGQPVSLRTALGRPD